jgi:hypothetical protein
MELSMTVDFLDQIWMGTPLMDASDSRRAR